MTVALSSLPSLIYHGCCWFMAVVSIRVDVGWCWLYPELPSEVFWWWPLSENLKVPDNTPRSDNPPLNLRFFGLWKGVTFLNVSSAKAAKVVLCGLCSVSHLPLWKMMDFVSWDETHVTSCTFPTVYNGSHVPKWPKENLSTSGTTDRSR